jgi:hypothetical protein
MAMEYTRGYCRHCDRNVRAERKATNSAPKVAACILTLGLAVPLLMLDAATTPYRCRRCGEKVKPDPKRERARRRERDPDPPKPKPKVSEPSRVMQAYRTAKAAYEAWEWVAWVKGKIGH